MKAKHRPCCYAKTVQGFDCSRLFYVRSRRKKNGLSLAHQVNTYTVVKKIEITKKSQQTWPRVKWRKLLSIICDMFYSFSISLNRKVSNINGVLLKHPQIVTYSKASVQCRLKPLLNDRLSLVFLEFSKQRPCDF